MRRSFGIGLCILLLMACGDNEDGYTGIGDGVRKKLLAFGDSPKRPDNVEYLGLATYLRPKHGGPWIKNNYFFRNVAPEYLGCPSFGEDIMSSTEGDSLSYELPYGCISLGLLDPFDGAERAPQLEDTLLFNITIQQLQSFQEYQASLAVEVSSGSLEENAFLEEYMLERFPKGDYKILGDVYFQKLRASSGPKINSGTEVELLFKGYFLNDSIFSSPNGDDTRIYFQVGKPDQVIKAMELALLQMSSGEKAKVYLPSHKGFGVNGSSTGLVPPKTSTYYELEVFALDSLGNRQL